jgi:hypothetical protein
MADTADLNVPATISKEQRNWAMLGHLSGLLAFLSIIGGIVGPFVLWWLRKDDMNFAADQAREALNFQITVFIAGLISAVLCLILIGFVLLALLAIVDILFIIIATMKAGEGVAYRYPLNLRLIS